MQFLKEQPNGMRKPVGEDTYMQDKFDPGFMQIIATGNIIIYRITGAGTRPAQKPLNYGGMRRIRNYYDSAKPAHNTVRVHNQERNAGLMNN